MYACVSMNRSGQSICQLFVAFSFVLSFCILTEKGLFSFPQPSETWYSELGVQAAKYIVLTTELNRQARRTPANSHCS